MIIKIDFRREMEIFVCLFHILWFFGKNELSFSPDNDLNTPLKIENISRCSSEAMTIWICNAKIYWLWRTTLFVKEFLWRVQGWQRVMSSLQRWWLLKIILKWRRTQQQQCWSKKFAQWFSWRLVKNECFVQDFYNPFQNIKMENISS